MNDTRQMFVNDTNGKKVSVFSLLQDADLQIESLQAKLDKACTPPTGTINVPLEEMDKLMAERESLQGDNKRLTKMIGTWRATNDANWASLMNIAKSKIEQRDKVCALRLHTQDDEGIWYSMTDCGLSGTIGYEESSLDDGRSFCPSCGGKVVIQSLENSDE